jgi:hypothetical protein
MCVGVSVCVYACVYMGGFILWAHFGGTPPSPLSIFYYIFFKSESMCVGVYWYMRWCCAPSTPNAWHMRAHISLPPPPLSFFHPSTHPPTTNILKKTQTTTTTNKPTATTTHPPQPAAQAWSQPPPPPVGGAAPSQRRRGRRGRRRRRRGGDCGRPRGRWWRRRS